MELIHYWRIVRRRWWLVAALVAIALLASLITYDRPDTVYQASMRFAIGVEGQEPVAAVSGEGRSDAGSPPSTWPTIYPRCSRGATLRRVSASGWAWPCRLGPSLPVASTVS